MRPSVYIKDLKDYVGKEVNLKGWLYNKRSSGKIKFLIMRDGSGYVQCVVFKGNVTNEIFENAEKLTQESSFEVTGKVKVEPRSVGGYELDATDVKIISVASEYPITPM